MWLLRSILCAGLLVLCSVCADTKQANVVYYDPPLKLAYADNIHPYAYAHQTPLPTYAPGTNAYSGFNAFDAFVESADSLEVRPLRADSPVAHNLIPAQMDLVPAAKYVEAEVASADSFLSVADELHAEVKTKAEVQAAATERSGRRRRVGIVMDTVKKLGGAVKDTLFGGNSKGDPKNPADPNPMPLKPNPSPFQPDPPYHGTFPGNDAYRRAVYGLRRRRMPYTTSTTFGSINPYRRPNDYHHNSRDMLFPRDRFAMAMNPMLTDLGRMGGSGFKRYGDYSSFTPNHMLPGQSDFRFRGRAMVGDLGDFGTVDPSRGMDAYFGHPPTPAMFGLGGGSPMAFNGYKFSKKRGMMFGNPLADGPSPFIPGMDQFFDFYKGGGGGAPAAGAPPAAGAAPPADGAAAPPAQQAGF